ncbi:hypothetical protein ACFFP0_28610 [Rhizobium puerariae]|uniref:Methyl-accepting chemotaxis protein n=1 Tax=Rhizobium puerariae TaxID=1585791 RepID=A0ABV6AQC0_9HYPH
MIRDRDPNELELQHMRIVVNALDSGVRRFAAADLGATLDSPFPAPWDGMRRDFNRGLNALNGTMDSVIGNARLLRDESDQLRTAMSEGAERQADHSARLSGAAAAAGALAQGLRQQKALARHTATIARNARLDLSRSAEAVSAALKLIEEMGSDGADGRQSPDRGEALSAATRQIGRELDALGLYLDALNEHAGNLAEAAGDQAEAASATHADLGELARSRHAASLRTDIATLALDRMDRQIAEIDQKASRFARVTVIVPPPHDPAPHEPGTRGSHLRLVKS